ncbi:MAG: tetratricopeptide repeat protein [Thermodesulfobacteriota bacterium]
MSRLLSTILCLSLLAILAGGCAARTADLGGARPSAAELERQGDELLTQGRREAAFMSYAKALAADPALHTARFKQGRLYADRGLHREALAAYAAVLEQRPADLAALEAAGRAAIEAGDREAAADFFRRALAVDPQRPEPHVFLAVLASRAGDHAAAEAGFRAALAIRPDCAEALNGLGLETLAAGRPAEAANLLVAALRAGAPAQRGFNNLGLALAAAGREEEALAAFTRAAGEAGGFNNLGLALLGQGRTAEAAALFQRAADHSPTYYVRAHRNLEQARLDLGSLTLAVPHSLAPQNPGPVPAVPMPPAPPGARKAAGAVVRTSFSEADLAEPALGRQPGRIAPASAAPAASAQGGADAEARAASGSPVNPETASAPDPAARPAGSYAVHLASFREAEAERARALAAEYGRRGVDALVYPCEVPGKGTWLRVAAGPFAEYAQAGEAADRLRADLGLDYARVVRLASGADGGR